MLLCKRKNDILFTVFKGVSLSSKTLGHLAYLAPRTAQHIITARKIAWELTGKQRAASTRSGVKAMNPKSQHDQRTIWRVGQLFHFMVWVVAWERITIDTLITCDCVQGDQGKGRREERERERERDSSIRQFRHFLAIRVAGYTALHVQAWLVTRFELWHADVGRTA